MLCINGELVKEIYTHEEAIKDCERSFAVVAQKRFNAPVRTFLNTKSQDFLMMPSSVQVEGKDDTSNVSLKILSIVPKNRERGLPLIVGKVMLIDDTTGKVDALIDGFMVTNKRTGAVAGTTAKVLHPAPATNVVIFGCGIQGYYGLESILSVHPEVKKVTAVDYFKSAAEKYVAVHSEKDKDREYVLGENIEAAVREADIIHCATTSKEALFDGNWVKDGAHISAIGCYTLEMRELPRNIFGRENVRVFVDEFEAMREEAGDVMDAVRNDVIKEENLHLFGHVITKECEGRQNDKQITIMKAVGVAAQDNVAATTIYRLAKEKGVGVLVDI